LYMLKAETFGFGFSSALKRGCFLLDPTISVSREISSPWWRGMWTELSKPYLYTCLK